MIKIPVDAVWNDCTGALVGFISRIYTDIRNLYVQVVKKCGREPTGEGRFCVLTSHHALQCGLAWQHSCLCSRHSLQWFKQTNKKGIIGDVATRFFYTSRPNSTRNTSLGTDNGSILKCYMSPKFQSSTLHEQRGLLHWSHFAIPMATADIMSSGRL